MFSPPAPVGPGASRRERRAGPCRRRDRRVVQLNRPPKTGPQSAPRTGSAQPAPREAAGGAPGPPRAAGTATAATRGAATMLSRIAESMFWIGRYGERAEDTARLLQAHLRLMVEDTSPRVDACRDLLALMSVDHIEASGPDRPASGAGLRRRDPPRSAPPGPPPGTTPGGPARSSRWICGTASTPPGTSCPRRRFGIERRAYLPGLGAVLLFTGIARGTMVPRRGLAVPAAWSQP